MKLFELRWLCCFLSLAICCASALAHDDNDGKGIGGASGSGSGGDGPFAHSRVQMLSRLPLDEIGSLGASNVLGNDIWGWTDLESGREFAIMGLTNGTSFIEVTDPTAPTYLGTLKTTAGTGNRAWRDMKVYKEQAYIVSDSNGAHGVQVFDLNQLLTASASDPTDPHYFSEVGIYHGVTSAHNIAINEESGFAYVVGSNKASGGLHVLDLNGGINGAMPTFVGDFSADGYTHDAQIVNYIGPDIDYAGREIAFNSNTDTLTIADVTNKASMTQISRTGYSGSGYVHQGWLSEDHQFFFMNDELDEKNSSTLIQTRTRVWDVSDLDAPEYLGYHDGEAATIDHNLYIKGDWMFQANYTSGLRVLKINDAATLDFEEWGFFDTYAADDDVTFNGAWSVFPYFDSGTVVVSDRQGGLFVLSVIPEPGSLTFLGLSALVVIGRRRRAR
jgi:choice-of-anchor B domain-containing protein